MKDLTREDYKVLWFAVGLIGTIVMLSIMLPVRVALLIVFIAITILALRAD